MTDNLIILNNCKLDLSKILIEYANEINNISKITDSSIEDIIMMALEYHLDVINSKSLTKTLDEVFWYLYTISDEAVINHESFYNDLLRLFESVFLVESCNYKVISLERHILKYKIHIYG